MSKNPFERHGIDHLSASSLNIFAAEPAFWCYKYLLGKPDTVGPSAWRGSAVEAGLDYWLFKREEGAAQKAALDRFELEAMGDLDEKVDRERARIPAMLSQAMQLFADKPEPTVRQLDITYWFDDIEVPIVGRIDYEWPEDGYDLKTTKNMPTHIPDGHARQISIYEAARKKPYRLAYVTEKKREIKQLSTEDKARHLRHAMWYAHNIRRGLATFSDKLELARIYPPDFNSFYWNDENRQLATEIWELPNGTGNN